MYLFWTIAAAMAFTLGGAFMKASHGMTRLGLTSAMYVSFAAGATFQALAMRRAELSMAYIFILGLEALLVFGLGQVFFAEKASWLKVVGVATIVIGMILMHCEKTSPNEQLKETANAGPGQAACLTDGTDCPLHPS